MQSQNLKHSLKAEVYFDLNKNSLSLPYVSVEGKVHSSVNNACDVDS